MTTTTTTLQAKRTFPYSGEGYEGRARITVTTETHGQSPYFSTTAEIFVPGRRDCEACGCLHADALRVWPEVAPLVALHLSDATTGAPMHAESNGWYWLAGALGGMGERYHGGCGTDARTAEDCMRIFMGHARISASEAQALAGAVLASTEPRKVFAQWIADQAERWANEAAAGRDLIARLSESTP